MKEKLHEAIKNGIRDREATQTDKERRLAAASAARTESFFREVESEKARLLKDDYIFELIKKAVAAGEDHAVLYNGRATSVAVSSIDGLHGEYKSGEAHINSDEVTEFWEQVTVTWSVG